MGRKREREIDLKISTIEDGENRAEEMQVMSERIAVGAKERGM